MQRKSNELDDEMLTLTAELLSSIPEFATLWNIRRELIEDWAANRYFLSFRGSREKSFTLDDVTMSCMLYFSCTDF